MLLQQSQTVQSWRKALLIETFVIFLPCPSEPELRLTAETSWIQRVTTSGLKLGSQIPKCKVIKYSIFILSFVHCLFIQFSLCVRVVPLALVESSNIKLAETHYRHILSNKPRGSRAAVPEPAVKNWHHHYSFSTKRFTCAQNIRLLLNPYKSSESSELFRGQTCPVISHNSFSLLYCR